MKTTAEMIAVMQHFANGGEVQYFNPNTNSWHPAALTAQVPVWDWNRYDYRIAKTKKVGWILPLKTDLAPDAGRRLCSHIYYNKSAFSEEDQKRLVKVEWEE